MLAAFAILTVLFLAGVHIGATLAVAGIVVLGCINAWMLAKTRRLAGEDATPIIDAQVKLFRTKMVTDFVLASPLLGGALLGALIAIAGAPIDSSTDGTTAGSTRPPA